MGKSIMELFESEPIGVTNAPAKVTYAPVNSKSIPVHSSNPLIETTSFKAINLIRTKISTRDLFTSVVETELSGVEAMRKLSSPILYNSEFVRINTKSSISVSKIKQLNTDREDKGLIGLVNGAINTVQKIRGAVDGAVNGYTPLPSLFAKKYLNGGTTNDIKKLTDKLKRKSKGIPGLSGLVDAARNSKSAEDFINNGVIALKNTAKSLAKNAIQKSLQKALSKNKGGSEESNRYTHIESYSANASSLRSLTLDKLKPKKLLPGDLQNRIERVTGKNLDPNAKYNGSPLSLFTKPNKSIREGNRTTNSDGTPFISDYKISNNNVDITDKYDNLSYEELLGINTYHDDSTKYRSISSIDYGIDTNSGESLIKIYNKKILSTYDIKINKYSYDDKNVSKKGYYDPISNPDNTVTDGQIESSTSNNSNFYSHFDNTANKNNVPFVKMLIVNDNDSKSFYSAITDIKDSMASTWTDNEFVGSPVKNYIYQNVERTIGFTLKLFATNPETHMAMWDTIEWLKRLTLPYDYKNGITIPKILKINVGAVFSDVLCAVDSVDVSHDETAGWSNPIWKLNSKFYDDDVLNKYDFTLPLVCDVNLSFKCLNPFETQKHNYVMTDIKRKESSKPKSKPFIPSSIEPRSLPMIGERPNVPSIPPIPKVPSYVPPSEDQILKDMNNEQPPIPGFNLPLSI